MPEAKGFNQEKRQLRIQTPLGKDKILIEKFDGRECISKLFEFDIDIYAQTDEAIKFEDLLGQSVTMAIESGGVTRYFNGLVSRISGGEAENSGVTATGKIWGYRARVVPAAWLMTKMVRSRIFQHKNVPDILKAVLGSISATWSLDGTYENRDYCVQYRESDYHFLSRLMEEEGIFYFFEHSDGKHQMVITDNIRHFAEVDSKANSPIYYGSHAATVAGAGDLVHVIDGWSKTQEIRSGKVTLWDHSFELPNKNLEAIQNVAPTLKAGTISHKLNVAGSDKYEIYDYPGEYAQRFDGIDAGGAEQAANLNKIFEDNKRTAKIRMEAESIHAVNILGEGTCQFLSAGHRFKLGGHEDADGEYVCVEVTHQGDIEGAYSVNLSDARLFYRNSFECVPAAATYRPERQSIKPSIRGSQTAVVVGPEGQEIFCDKYGRVKVQFHWDREGKRDQDSSCWIRVASLWAGKQWGVLHTPRIGQEVVVDFIEGDPDQPIIVGSVYNAEQMPPYDRSKNPTQAGLKSRSSLKGNEETFNELRFEDLLDKEHIYFHAQKDMQRVVENEDKINVGFGKDSKNKEFKGSQFVDVYQDRTTAIHKGNEKLTVMEGKREVTISKGDEFLTVTKGKRTVVIEGNESFTINSGNRDTTISKGNDTLTITKGNQTVTISGGNMTFDVSKNVTINADKVTIDAKSQILLQVRSNSVKISSSGVDINGQQVNVTGSTGATLDGGTAAKVTSATTEISGSGMTKISGGVVKIN